jgi:hypothetical protein
MKTIISIPVPQCRLKKLYTAVLISAALLISGGFTVIPSCELQDDSLKDRKLKLLEKLENGKILEQEEIMSSFLHDDNNEEAFIPFDYELEDIYRNLHKEFLHFDHQSCNPLNQDEISKAIQHYRNVHEQLMEELGKLKDEMIRLKSELSEMNFPAIM